MTDLAQIDAAARTFMRRQLHGFTDFSASSIVLIVANLLPLLGVIFIGWDAFSIVALYWVENVVLGLINVLKLIVAKGIGGALASIFFVFHYGMFCFIHGIFVLAIFGHDARIFSPADEFREFARLFSEQHLWWAISALAASHLFSFAVNFIGRGEYKKQGIGDFMSQAYGRVVVLHLAIIFGGWIAMALGSSLGVLFLLIVGKTLMDLKLHVKLHEQATHPLVTPTKT
jgi:hypothetical protein